MENTGLMEPSPTKGLSYRAPPSPLKVVENLRYLKVLQKSPLGFKLFHTSFKGSKDKVSFTVCFLIPS